jgi:hypothetical protein
LNFIRDETILIQVRLEISISLSNSIESMQFLIILLLCCVKLEILTSLTNFNAVFCVVTPCSLIWIYQLSIFRAEVNLLSKDCSWSSFGSFGKFLPKYEASHPRRRGFCACMVDAFNTKSHTSRRIFLQMKLL